MTTDTLPFFRGISVAAAQARPTWNPVVLTRDARILTRRFFPHGIQEALNPDDLASCMACARSWMSYRSEEHTKALPEDAVILDTNAIKLERAGMGKELPDISALATEFPDLEFAELLAGTQFGMKHFRPNLSPRVLTRDWHVIRNDYDESLQRYSAAGLSMDAERELMARDYSYFRLAAGSLGWIDIPLYMRGFFGGDRFGWLIVNTSPDAVSVFVDNADWGPSPIEEGVPVGPYTVVAKRDQRSRTEKVTVAAAKKTLVHLDLTGP